MSDDDERTLWMMTVSGYPRGVFVWRQEAEWFVNVADLGYYHVAPVRAERSDGWAVEGDEVLVPEGWWCVRWRQPGGADWFLAAFVDRRHAARYLAWTERRRPGSRLTCSGAPAGFAHGDGI